MGSKIIYTCNICREEKNPEKLVGIVFTDYYNFKLGSPSETQGVHICIGCAEQLKQLLNGFQ